MTCTHFAEGQVLFREGDPADSVFRLLTGAVGILRDVDADPVLLGTVGGKRVAGEGPPPLEPNLKLDDTAPFRLSRNHFIIEKRDGSYHVRDLRSTLGTIVNGEPIGDHFRADGALLRAGENEVIAGG